MLELKVFYCLFLLTLLDATSQIRPSLHNNAFVQDDNDVQYLLDNMPISIHKDFANTVHAGDAASDEDKMEDSFSHISFEPNILDFKERFKVNNTAEILVVAVEVEVKSGAGLHWGGSSGIINLGMGGSLQPPIRTPIALKNSAKKAIKVVNIINTPVSKALKLHFEPAIIPGETDVPIAIGMLIYDWKTGLDLQHFKGKLIIKAIGPGGSSQKLAIPWIAQVLQGGLEVNTSITHYCSPQSSQARNFSVVNRFKLPLAITNVTMCSNAKSLFTIKDFTPRVIKPEQKINIFSLQLAKERKIDNVKMESSILIHSNVSVTEVPVLSYDGKLKKIIPGEKEDDMEIMNFGTVGSGTENEAIFALENQNPVNVELHSWGVNMPGAVLELMGCQNGPADLLDKEFRNITVCSHSGNQYIKPEFLAIFKIKVKTPMVEEDTIVGDVFVRTTYERFILPVYMRVAHGKISLKKLIFTDCFPGSICVQQVKVHSTFSRPMEVTHIAPINRDNRIKYIPLEEATMPVISKGENNVGSIQIDPSVTCKQRCYLGLSLDTNTGNQWLNTMSLPSHTRDSDLNFLNTRYVRFINSTADGSWENITMRLDTTEVRSHRFYVNIKPYWPSLLAGSSSIKNKSVLMFPLTQVGNTSYRAIKLHNPSASPLIVQLVMDWSYPQGARLYHSLPIKFKPVCVECLPMIPEEFKLEENADERELFEKQWGVTIALQSLPLYLNPSNNMTILEVLRMSGRGASAQFRFGHRKPGSTTPLLFELTDKHLKDCERDRNKLVTTLTIKRSFTARNTGELPIEIYGFYINDWHCEGYGFKVLDCTPFKLSPNATKRIEIAFTPDFTLSRVERKLLVMTSMGPDADENVENGVVILNLLATLPAHALNLCASVLARPPWEGAIQKAAIILSSVLMLCVAVVSFLEADRILREGLANYSKENSVQPPLDLRLLSHISSNTQGSSGGSGCVTNKNDKTVTSDEKSKTKKDEVFPDWSLMNVKKYKDKDVQKGLKIPDWSAEEERKFKLDTESKDLLSFKRFEELSNVDNAANTTNMLVSKKKNNKKQNNVQEAQSDNCITNDVLTDTQLIQEKKYIVNTGTKSSPTSNRKGKTQSMQSSIKDEPKFNDHEIQMDAVIINNNRANKSDNKRNKQINSNSSNNNNHNNHVSLKKLEPTSTPKTIHLSEEETSSTTTESSTHDETISCKSFDQPCGKQEKLQRKPVSKKSKPQSIPPVPCIDYKDNYEGDCDDDEYDKEKQNNPNRWKTNTTRSNTKHIHTSRTVESSFKLSRQNKNPPRKEKTVQKRRVADKIHIKSPPINGNASQKEDVTRIIGTMPTPLPPPPSCWGENRAKFSDVVARSQEIVSSFSNLNHMNHKSQTNMSNLSTIFNTDIKDVQCAKSQLAQESSPTLKEYSLMSNPVLLCSTTVNNKSLETDPSILQSKSQHSNSYFINTFTEHPFECELVPYDDLPETDEPLVELETPEEDTRCQLWEDTSPMINLLSESTNGFQLESPKTPEKPVLSDLKDNWTVDTNWEPLHTRAAVGEERGVWGINTGGVWAAAPWGAAAPPMLSQTLQSEADSQERSGFDPFRSLNTIWTPSSTESWKTRREN
ncbi:hypothetical protein ALC57_04555 [Trachymyrmex cornetzi]|uniref:Transmembrane protein 131 n=1 Tax=Trachymyrmex cornetzi TaxID=471704 RepID=A0A195EC23_9HYME|nr:hypothetical protein ALC57_04555 [Trachymyrmex cornetzi]